MLRSVVDVLFPPRCAGCGAGPWPFCAGCHAQVVPLLPPWCERCGLPSGSPVERCDSCPPEPIALARAPFLFEGPVRSAVHRLKFAGWRTVAAALAEAMAATLDGVTVDAVTWVPLSRERLASRGYDQAAALARALAPRLGVRAAPLLARVRETGAQARRGRAERAVAVAGAFAAPEHLHERVLLVDDVLTTGATAAECARVLRAAGARYVALVTAARAVPSRRSPGYTRVGSRSGLWLPGEAVPR